MGGWRGAAHAARPAGTRAEGAMAVSPIKPACHPPRLAFMASPCAGTGIGLKCCWEEEIGALWHEKSITIVRVIKQ